MIYDLSEGYFVRGLQASDLEGPYLSWFEDQEVCRFNSHGKFSKPAEHYRRYVSGLETEDQLVWAICHRTAGHVGNVSLQQLSFINRGAEFAILLGDKAHWRKGVGALAGRALLQHGFKKLNLHRVYCATAVTNTGMIRVATALRMREEGRRRDALFLDGSWVDVLEFGVLREEFLKPE